MGKLRKAEAILLGLENALLVAIVAFLVCMSFTQVLLRLLFGGGLLWADTLDRHLVLWAGFLGAAAAAACEKHFAFEALAPRLPAPWRAAAAGLSRLATVAVSLLLAKASWSFLLDERLENQTLFMIGRANVPGWPLAAILPLAFGLVALHTALRAVLERMPEDGPRSPA
ncbi:MAG: TRAP transporter small permease [Elusimicrobia bacterium]|nr:TRAP transporter small permease [Elusimicrobiota bacterium]